MEIRKARINYKKTLKVLILTIYSIAIFKLSLSNETFFTSPDENSIYFYTEKYVENPAIRYKYKYDITNSFGSIRPRGTIIVNENIVPILSNGMIIYNGTFQLFFPKNYILLFTPLMFIVSIYYYEKIVKYLFNEKVAYASLIEYSTLAPFIYLATKPMVLDIATLSLVMIGTYYDLTSNYEARKSLLTGIFWGISIIFNHKTLFILSGYVLYKLVKELYLYINRRSERNSIVIRNIKYFSSILIGLIPAIGIIAVTNQQLYGHFLTDGYVARAAVNKSAGAAEAPVFFINFPKILGNISTYYYYFLTPVFCLLSILGVVNLVKNIKKRYRPDIMFDYLAFLGISAVIIFSYFASIANWGYGMSTISASFIRYLLPVYALIIPIILSYLFKFKAKTIIVLILVTINMYSLEYFITSGYLATYGYVNNVKNIKEKIIKHTSKNDIIVTNYYDKVLFPERETTDLSALPIVYKNGYPVYQSKSVVKLIEYICLAKGQAYLINDIEKQTINEVKEELEKKKYSMRETAVTSDIILLSIKKEKS